MYTREVSGKELELGVSGKLYKDALVMFDRETGTLWTQVDGSALRGPLVGRRLAEVPAMQTTWKVWKRLHPNTLVLRKPATVRGSRYEEYFADPAQLGPSGTRGDERLAGKALIIGLHSAEDAIAIPVSIVEKRQLVETELAGEPLVVFYSRENRTAAVFRANVTGRRLSFRIVRRAGLSLLEDAETHSEWSPLEGRAISGPLKDTRLEQVPYFHSYWYAWSAYRPQTRIVR